MAPRTESIVDLGSHWRPWHLRSVGRAGAQLSARFFWPFFVKCLTRVTLPVSQVNDNVPEEGQPQNTSLSLAEKLALSRQVRAAKIAAQFKGLKHRKSAPARIVVDGDGDDERADEQPTAAINRRRSAPAALAPPGPPRAKRDAPREMFTYADDKEAKHMGSDKRSAEFQSTSSSAPTAASSSAASSASASASASSSLGHGIWDEAQLAAAIEELSTKVCPGCKIRAPVAFVRDVRCGLGGSLVFRCKTATCTEMRPFERSRPAENDGKGTKGRKACATTRRAVHAMTEVGLGYRAGGEALLVGLDIGRLSTGTWQRAAAVTAKAEEKVNSGVMEANLKEEISATLEAEGPSANAPNGMGVYITVLTDGSWQKRMGRNSFFGVGAFYGARTNKLLFCSTRVARCAICMSAAARGKQAARDHDCTKTWDERKGKDGAASNMEKAMALEGANFLFERGAVV